MDTILLIDDNEAYCEQIKKTLSLRNFNLHYESNAQKAITIALNNKWDVILLDVVFNQNLQGLELLEIIKKAKPDVPVIMVSGTSTMDSAMEALQKGAFDFLEKPIDVDRMIVTIKHALDQKHLSDLNKNLIEEFYSAIASETWRQIIQQALDALTGLNETVRRILLLGEKGTGKKFFAKILHFKSERKYGPFIVFHCDAHAFENENALFGPANSLDNPGQNGSLIRKANNGTLFLSEISHLSAKGQKMLMRFIHENYYMPPQNKEKQVLNIRLITSSSVDLKPLVEKKAFSEKLFNILKTVTFKLPSLREHPEEIPLFVNYFLDDTAQKLNRTKPMISDQAMEVLKKQIWANNLSELKMVIWHLLFLNNASIIDEAMVKKALVFYHLMQNLQQQKNISEVIEDLKKYYNINNNLNSQELHLPKKVKKSVRMKEPSSE